MLSISTEKYEKEGWCAHCGNTPLKPGNEVVRIKIFPLNKSVLILKEHFREFLDEETPRQFVTQYKKSQNMW